MLIISYNLFQGNIETKSEAAYVTSRNVALRNELDMYAYVLNCKSYPGVTTRHKDIDVCIIRYVEYQIYHIHLVILKSNRS